jgi:hypothetical protein
VFPAFLLGHGYFLSSASMRFFLCHTFMNCPNCFLARVSLLLWIFPCLLAFVFFLLFGDLQLIVTGLGYVRIWRTMRD